jgi:hypothetical protein
MTLFVPRGCRGIVSIDGVIQLRRVLLPIDHQPDAQEAVMRAVRAAEAFADDAVEIVLLHVNGCRKSIAPKVRHACGKKYAARAMLWRQSSMPLGKQI